MSGYNWDNNEDFLERFMKHFGDFGRGIFGDFEDLMKGIEPENIDDDFEVKKIEGPGIRGYIFRKSLRYPAKSNQRNGVPVLPKPTRPTPRKPFPLKPERRDPFVELIEEGSDLIVIAEVPGVEKDDVKIDLVNGVLEIDAGNRFYKEIQLPGNVDFDKAKANCSNGILEIRIPKDGNKD